MAQLIDKSALVAEINRVLNSYDPNEITSGRYALVDLRNFINTLEVKEVNLEKEINDYFITVELCEGEKITENTFRKIAKHFFELGIAVNNKE